MQVLRKLQIISLQAGKINFELKTRVLSSDMTCFFLPLAMVCGVRVNKVLFNFHGDC